MKTHFIQALEDLKNMLAEIALKAEAAVKKSIVAVEHGACADARQIVWDDSWIDAQEIRIEEECLKILALHQPVASDLRQVITILKVNNEIERIGDLAVNIADRVEDISLYMDGEMEKISFHKMSSLACEMLKNALDSLAYHDADMAAQVIQADDAVDELHKANYPIVRNSIIAHPQQAQYYMDCITISRCLERIADIATNIAEDVIYLESGHIVRHIHPGESNEQQ